MSISVDSIIEYVQFENQHPRLVGVLRNNIYKYYFPDMNAAIAVVVRLNQYLNFRTDGDDLFMISTKFKHDRKNYNTNKGLLKLFLENDAYIAAICDDIVRIGSAIQLFERNWVSELTLPRVGDMASVNNYMTGLRRQLEDFEEYKENRKDLGDLADERTICSSNRRTYLRAFELDCRCFIGIRIPTKQQNSHVMIPV